MHLYIMCCLEKDPSLSTEFICLMDTLLTETENNFM